MNRVERARRFAQLAYSAARGEIVREFDEKRHASRLCSATLGKRMILEPELEAQEIAATIKAQLKTLLDGYELCGVPIDDETATAIATEVGRSLEARIAPPGRSLPKDFTSLIRDHTVRQHLGISSAWIRSEIDRRRFLRKPQTKPFTLFHIEGDQPQGHVNRVDNSVDAVIRANRHLLAGLRDRIESCLREGSERTLILEKLTALEQAHSLPSFAQRYSDFIAASANHILLFTPFNSALTEMIHKVLS